MVGGIGATAAARKHFDQAMAVFETDAIRARRLFQEATDADPAMADAWLGRVAAGDDELRTLEALHTHGDRGLSRRHRARKRVH